MEQSPAGGLSTSMSYGNLLNASDGDPVRSNSVPVTESPFLLVGDHAGNAVPSRLEALGLSPKDRSRHIALDLGVKDLGRALGNRLNAPFLWQHFSRLVCDCNRNPDDPEWAAQISDGTKVPGNFQLSIEDKKARRESIFDPYHDAIASAISRRRAVRQPTIFVSLHTFTPSMEGKQRPWDIGILHDGQEEGFALSVLSLLKAKEGNCIGDNQPYDMDETDYTVPRHAYPLRLPYIEVEVRQDLLSSSAGIDEMANLLGDTLQAAMPRDPHHFQ